mmetsp:Transcript_60238/g.126025  ORF Transcript_60238/g.126025 Transcript_60238/m.126025 type:complete len:523 (-) Transcript_60238:122-1690(-)|eukprot:CAMPEP_0172176410 /NCGR_PEP_ID=MMETSP1050-20130122/14792_1 /TAXON_ID=233186 /ORGANISM="Cryptomonas curvata, Strain CCAP979/52" /LENGTH=522 /DNA_ID=CAMNT_0012848669 /DNA_START=114 /DNA_END=1682 /DNA_ORIENTATION=+
MAVSIQHCLKYLEDSETLPSSTNKFDPISATPDKLAYYCDLLWQRNEQKNLPGKHKNDPDNLPLSFLNFVAESIDIPKATNMRLTEPHASVASAPQESDSGSSEPSEQQVLAAIPLLDIPGLVYQGFARSNLPPSSDPVHYGATGRLLSMNTVLRRKLRSIYLMTDRSLTRLNADFWPVINNLIDLTKFPGLSPVFPAAHAFQRLLILLATKTFHLNMEIRQNIALVGTTPLKNTDDLGRLILELTSLSTLDNILDRQSPFQPPKNIVDQALLHLQRGSSLSHFPLHIRSALDKIIHDFLAVIQDGHTVLPSAILIRFTPYFPVPSPSLDQPDTLNAMMAREYLLPRTSIDSTISASNTIVHLDPPEVALLARQDTRRDYHNDRRDLRPEPRSVLRQDVRRDFRPDSRPASRQDIRGSARSDSRNDSRIEEPRDFRSPPDPTLEDLQKNMAALQSQLDKHARQVRQVHASSPRRDHTAFMAQASDPDEIAYSAFITDATIRDGHGYSTHPRPLGTRTTTDSD